MSKAMTFEEIGDALHISKVRAFQLYEKGMRKLQKEFPETLAMLYEQSERTQQRTQNSPYYNAAQGKSA